MLSPIYQQFRMFEEEGVAPSAPDLFSIELFCTRITKLMAIYQEKEPEYEDLLPKKNKFTKAYSTKKMS